MDGTIAETLRKIAAELTNFGFDLVAALVILIVGWCVASWAERATRKALDKTTRVEKTLKPILGQAVRYSILVFVLIAILGQFGVQTASLLAVLGTAGLAIGLALQGTLRDLAAGFMILLHRPFRIEDDIETNKIVGVVQHVGPFVTTLKTRDGVYLSVPNSVIWSNPIYNNTRNPERRVEIIVGVNYNEDIDRVIRILEEELQSDKRVLADLKNMVAVKELGESSVVMVVRAWAASTEFRKFAFDFTRQIKKRFDQEGIQIPYPYRNIQIVNNGKLFESKTQEMEI